MAVICEFLDRDRFPWLAGKRARCAASGRCRSRCVAMTARIMAEQRAQTRSRTESSRAQEEAVRRSLLRCGLEVCGSQGRSSAHGRRSGMTPSAV